MVKNMLTIKKTMTENKYHGFTVSLRLPGEFLISLEANIRSISLAGLRKGSMKDSICLSVLSVSTLHIQPLRLCLSPGWQFANKFSDGTVFTNQLNCTLSKSTAGVQHSEGRAATNQCRCSRTAAVNRLWWGRMRRSEASAETNHSCERCECQSRVPVLRFITSVLHYITSCNAYLNTLQWTEYLFPRLSDRGEPPEGWKWWTPTARWLLSSVSLSSPPRRTHEMPHSSNYRRSEMLIWLAG